MYYTYIGSIMILLYFIRNSFMFIGFKLLICFLLQLKQEKCDQHNKKYVIVLLFEYSLGGMLLTKLVTSYQRASILMSQT